MALAPEPGVILVDQLLVDIADADPSDFGGRLDLDADVFFLVDLFQLYYAFDGPVLGGRFVVGGYLPVGYGSTSGTLNGARIDDTVFGLGDLGLIPASLYWTAGSFHLNLYELIYAPTGQYDPEQSINIGLNQWSFDSILAVTWLNAGTSTEVSLVPGVMLNTENPATRFQEGAEFHLDVVVNQHVSNGFAFGAHGYYYDQFTADSGPGAALGSFEGHAVGVGPAVVWAPHGSMNLSTKWLHDLNVENVLDSEWITITLVWAW